jgi:hypothetical protein
MQRNTDNENGAEIELFELEPIDRNQIVKKILERHRKKFLKVLPNLVEELDEKMPRTMDLYLFLGKITIWFVQTKPSLIEELRWIWSNSEKLITELKNLRESNPKALENLVKRTSIIEHMIILAYIVTQIHIKEGYASKNPNVAGVFKNITEFVVRFGNNCGSFKDHTMTSNQLMRVANEYKEFRNIDFDKENLFKFFLSFSSKILD